MQSQQQRKVIRILSIAASLGLMAGSALAQDVAVVPLTPPSTVAAPQPPITTLWQKLGIPQNTVRVRDSLINRRGNLPFLEKKPPVLKLADPRNLMKGQPEMVKAAAEIKMAKDMKPQKIKALKFLADVNCGCYNKDGKVEAAFLEALDDCDPDVRMAAIEGLSKAAGSDCESCRDRRKKRRENCSICKGSASGCNSCNECSECSQSCGDECTTNCCTRKLQDKLQDIAYGMTDEGCYKEPVAEIRAAAEALLCKCPCATPLEPEELVRPDRMAPEELVPPPPPKAKPTPVVPIEGGQTNPEEEKTRWNNGYSMQLSDSSLQRGFYASARPVELSLSDRGSVPVPSILAGTTPEAQRLADASGSGQYISNPNLLLDCKTVANRSTVGEILLELPFASQIQSGWQVVVVDREGHQVLGTITDVGGRRILVALDQARPVRVRDGETVGFGILAR